MTEICTNIVPLSHALIRRTAQASSGGTNTGDNRHNGQPTATARAMRKNSQGQDNSDHSPVWGQSNDRRKTDRRASPRRGPQSAKVTTRYATTFAAQVAGQWYAQSDTENVEIEQRVKTRQAANDAYRNHAKRPGHLVLVDIEN